MYRKYKNNGFKSDDRASLDAHRIICSQAVLNAKEKYLKEQGEKLANPNTAQKTYWKILNTFLNKCKIPRIPPLCVDNKFITDCKDKAKQFNLFFASQCTPFTTDSVLPDFTPLTDKSLHSISFTETEIKKILQGLDVNKANGPD